MLVQKELRNTDVGNLGRIVLPKVRSLFLYLGIITMFHPIRHLTFDWDYIEKGRQRLEGGGGLVCFVCQFDRIH